ncbi:MAG: TerB family tellurite resistance protein [Longimicrobiales bacterium]
MTMFTELVCGSGVRDTLGVSGIPGPLFVQIARALKVVLAADGELHPAEVNEYLDTCRRYGAPDEMLDELRDFDPSVTSIEECFGGIAPESIPYKALLYDAIRIAKADGSYAMNERAAVRNAARILGINDDGVMDITALVDAEDAMRSLRFSMLCPSGLRSLD